MWYDRILTFVQRDQSVAELTRLLIRMIEKGQYGYVKRMLSMVHAENLNSCTVYKSFRSGNHQPVYSVVSPNSQPSNDYTQRCFFKTTISDVAQVIPRLPTSQVNELGEPWLFDVLLEIDPKKWIVSRYKPESVASNQAQSKPRQ
jgi:hypothetical protein